MEYVHMDEERARGRRAEVKEHGRKAEGKEYGRTAEVSEYAHRVVVKADQAAVDREQAPKKKAADGAFDKAHDGRAEAGVADAANEDSDDGHREAMEAEVPEEVLEADSTS
jgi:hypothetical protein